MQYQSLIAYIFVVVFAMTIALAQANNEREQFADLLQKRKHLNGYWVGKRYIVTSDEEPSLDSGKRKKKRNFFLDCFFF
jgi:Ni,Fe-hydrogenase I cytochrome b subunit